MVLVSLAAMLAWCLPAAGASPLPDGRAWELVSPPEKDGASITPLGFGIFGPIGGMVQAAEDGSALTYVADAPVEPEPEGNRAIEGTQVISRRSSSAWTSKDIVTPHSKGEGLRAGTPQEYRLFSGDLALGVLVPFGFQNPLMEPPLTPGATSEERSVYRRHNFLCTENAAACFEPIVNAEDVTGTEEGRSTPYGGRLEYVSSSPDLNHVVVKAAAKLTASAPPEGGLYEWNAGAPASERLQYVSLPAPAKSGGKVKPAPAAQLGNNEQGVYENARGAISADGRRVFWIENKEGSRSRLFMRDTQKQVTLHVNASKTGREASATKNEVRFQVASADGSRVFFLDNAPLTTDSKLKASEHGPTDLYVCEVVEVGGTPECKLTDLTASFAGPGSVAGEILGASSDGTTVYFVADGAPSGSAPGTCEIPGGNEEVPGGICYLYRSHYNGTSWEAPKLIKTLSEEDHPDWGGGFAAGHYLWNLTARVSSDGRYLAFMSNSTMPGYDNRDANPAAKEARDEEVFLYDASTETATCASCNPNPAQRPAGVLDQKFAGEGQNLRVDPAGVWEGKWLAASIPGWTPVSPEEAPYQARYLLDDGRLFFNSADALVPQDTNKRAETIEGAATEVGVEDVYQYEPAGLGSCTGPGACVSLVSSGTSGQESAFMDSSAGGSDVFFLTAQPLVSTDIDGNFDVYDAHVCSEASPCIAPPPPPPAPCNGEASCRGGGSAPPGFGPTASETFSGPGNAAKLQTLPSKTTVPPAKALTRKQKLARALASCRKRYKHARHKRAACERRARKAFGTSHRGGGR